VRDKLGYRPMLSGGVIMKKERLKYENIRNSNKIEKFNGNRNNTS
jgi:hypothetical protein